MYAYCLSTYVAYCLSLYVYIIFEYAGTSSIYITNTYYICIIHKIITNTCKQKKFNTVNASTLACATC